MRRQPKAGGNGHVIKTSFGVADPIALNRLERITANITSGLDRTRAWHREFGDDRRSINDECGYPADLETSDYFGMYARNSIARRVVQLMPKEAHQTAFKVYEDEKSGRETAFEKALKDLPQSMRGEHSWFRGEEGDPLRDVILQADVACGIGSFGVILLGLDDLSSASAPSSGAWSGLEQPVRGFEERGSLPKDKKGLAASSDRRPYQLTVNAEAAKGRRLLFARAFDESVVTVGRFESNQASSRYMQPVTYSINLNDSANKSGVGSPGGSINVHWSRVVHYPAAELENSVVFGVPEMRPCWNLLYDIAKIHGASGETFWRNCVLKTFLETHPQLGGDVEVDDDELKDAYEQFQNGLQQVLLLKGMTAKSIPPAVVDPSPHLKAKIESVCIVKNIPVRIFMGSERGELASSQDDASWNDKVMQWQRSVTTPRRVVPVYDRLIQTGVLPRLDDGYRVWWPDLESISEDAAAMTANKWADLMTKYLQGDLGMLMTPMDLMTRLMRMTEEEAESVLKQTLEWVEFREWSRKKSAIALGDEYEFEDEWSGDVPIGADEAGIMVGTPPAQPTGGAPPPGVPEDEQPVGDQPSGEIPPQLKPFAEAAQAKAGSAEEDEPDEVTPEELAELARRP